LNIREIEHKDLDTVSAICLASFSQSVASTLSETGISTFTQIAASNAFFNRMQQDNLMLVAEQDEKIVGVIEFKEGRHVAMLFIAPEHQKKGEGIYCCYQRCVMRGLTE
jgi:predicted N-acetyltransferase YhbS